MSKNLNRFQGILKNTQCQMYQNGRMQFLHSSEIHLEFV